MKNDNLEKLLQKVEEASSDEEFVVLRSEQAEGLFGGKFICLDLGFNNGNCG